MAVTNKKNIQQMKAFSEAPSAYNSVAERTENKQAERQRLYQQKQDRNSVKIRLSIEERTAINLRMKEEEWTNRASFMREKVFSIPAWQTIQDKVKNGDKLDFLIALEGYMSGLIENYKYIISTYEGQLCSLMDSNEEFQHFDEITRQTKIWIGKMERETIEIQKTINDLIKAVKNGRKNT